MWIVLYLFFLVSQLGKHWWPVWSFVYGIKVDYLSPILYLTDLVWLGAFVSNFQFSIFNFQKRKQRQGWIAWIVLIIIDILMADRWQICLYKWFRWWQLWWWVEYLADNKKMVVKVLPKIISWWIMVEFVLAIGQVVNGGSLGGVFYWLGERRFDYMTVGIARISWFGDNFVRAYGTFSHPNSLAGFLLVVMFLFNKIKDKNSNKTRIWIINWLAIIAIILTGSRLVWAVGLLTMIFKLKSKIGLKMVLVGLMLMVGGLLFENKIGWLGGWSSQSFILRLNLNKSALKIISQSPIFGVGLGNFLVKLPDYLFNFWIIQPVHNIFLLVLAEMGIVGFSWLWIFLNKKIEWKKFGWIWVVVILTGMFDHYWLSLPQNLAIVGVVMGLSLRNSKI